MPYIFGVWFLFFKIRYACVTWGSTGHIYLVPSQSVMSLEGKQVKKTVLYVGSPLI